MLTTSKKVFVLLVDMEPQQRCVSSDGPKKLTALRLDFSHRFGAINLANNHLLTDLW